MGVISLSEKQNGFKLIEHMDYLRLSSKDPNTVYAIYTGKKYSTLTFMNGGDVYAIGRYEAGSTQQFPIPHESGKFFCWRFQDEDGSYRMLGNTVPESNTVCELLTINLDDIGFTSFSLYHQSDESPYLDVVGTWERTDDHDHKYQFRFYISFDLTFENPKILFRSFQNSEHTSDSMLAHFVTREDWYNEIFGFNVSGYQSGTYVDPTNGNIVFVPLGSSTGIQWDRATNKLIDYAPGTATVFDWKIRNDVLLEDRLTVKVTVPAGAGWIYWSDGDKQYVSAASTITKTVDWDKLKHRREYDDELKVTVEYGHLYAKFEGTWNTVSIDDPIQIVDVVDYKGTSISKFNVYDGSRINLPNVTTTPSTDTLVCNGSGHFVVNLPKITTFTNYSLFKTVAESSVPPELCVVLGVGSLASRSVVFSHASGGGVKVVRNNVTTENVKESSFPYGAGNESQWYGYDGTSSYYMLGTGKFPDGTITPDRKIYINNIKYDIPVGYFWFGESFTPEYTTYGFQVNWRDGQDPRNEQGVTVSPTHEYTFNGLSGWVYAGDSSNYVDVYNVFTQKGYYGT